MSYHLTVGRASVWLLSLTGGVFLLMLCLSSLSNASMASFDDQLPRWIEIPLSYGPSIDADAYQHFIIWSQYGWPDAPPSCTLTDTLSLRLASRPLINSGGFLSGGGASILPWQQIAPPDVDWDICLYDLWTGQVTHVTNTGAQDQWPRMDGDWIVFRRGSVSNRRIIAVNLATSQAITLPRDPAVPQPDAPNIHQGHVVYKDFTLLGPQYELAGKIMAYDLDSQELLTITASPDYAVDFLDVYSQTIVWQQSPTATQDYDIVGYDLAGHSFFTVSAQPGDELHPRIDGSIVVWEWQGNIYGYDLAANERLTITQAAGTQAWPAVSGSLVVWTDDRNGPWDIFAYDLAGAKEYRVTNETMLDAYHPAVWGNVVAWDHYLDGTGAAWQASHFVYLPALHH